MTTVDLNCDCGESFGPWRMGADVDLFAHVTSANIACGFHAGDPMTMASTILEAARQGVAIGAHPGLPDLVGFGRREMKVTPHEVYTMVLYQVAALGGMASTYHGISQQAAYTRGQALLHVKPHGALYNMAAGDRRLADMIAKAVADYDPGLVLVGLAGSELLRAGEARGLRVASEVFADRNYLPDGSLVPRSREDAIVTDESHAIERAVRMVTDGRVTAVDGTEIAVRADTICIHGDGPHAVPFARGLRAALEAAGVTVKAPPFADQL